jgi:hypothetical protein
MILPLASVAQSLLSFLLKSSLRGTKQSLYNTERLCKSGIASFLAMTRGYLDAWVIYIFQTYEVLKTS